MEAIYILGNSGAGKSFLANVMLNEECFLHKISSTAVTLITEHIDRVVGGKQRKVFNIPGLIENEEAAITKNKREIYNAFTTLPFGIVVYVFRVTGGRLAAEDFQGFEASDAAYNFPREALCFIVNDLADLPVPVDEQQYISVIAAKCKTPVPKVAFCKRMVTASDKAEGRNSILKILKKCEPKRHVKTVYDIDLASDRLKKKRQQLLVLQQEQERAARAAEEEARKMRERIAAAQAARQVVHVHHHHSSGNDCIIS